MKISQYILAILALTLFGACNLIPQPNEDKAWNNIRNSDEIEEVISFALNYPNAEKIDSCTIKLEKLARLKPHIRLYLIMQLDSITGEIKYSTGDTNNDTFDYRLKKRNTYVITIKEDGVFESERRLHFPTLKDSINNLLTYAKHNYKRPEFRLTDVKYFGTILASKLVIILDTNIEEFEANTKINWELYFDTFVKIESTYIDIWNAKALEVWNKKFSALDYDKKLAIIESLPFHVEFSFTKRT